MRKNTAFSAEAVDKSVPKEFFLQTDLKSVYRKVSFHLVVKIHAEAPLKAKV